MAENAMKETNFQRREEKEGERETEKERKRRNSLLSLPSLYQGPVQKGVLPLGDKSLDMSLFLFPDTDISQKLPAEILLKMVLFGFVIISLGIDITHVFWTGLPQE